MNRYCRASLTLAASTALSVLIAACGGSSADTTPRVAITSVKVMGDSLADVGTFGIKFTIQGNDTYPERIAQLYGLPKGCNYYLAVSTTPPNFTKNTTKSCTNFAIGGGVINPASVPIAADNPLVIAKQFADANLAGNFASTDLLIVDGGGNDAASLVGAYLAAVGGDPRAYSALLRTLLPDTQVDTAFTAGQAGLASAGLSYMSTLADTFYKQIADGLLAKGALRVAVLNVPAITKTPRFQLVLDSIAASAGSGAQSAAARAQLETLFNGWVQAYNTQLAKRFAGESRVVVVDFYTEFNNQIATPAQFGLTNVKQFACPVAGTDTATGLPYVNFATCTDAFLAANPPAGATGGANWYKTWAFSDGFHPSAYGHQLLSQLISRSLAVAGWL